MSEFRSEKQEKRTESEVLFMNAVVEASALLREVAEPRPIGDTVKSAITRASRRVSRFLLSPMSAGRAEDIWRQEAKAIRAEEMDAIRRAASDRRLVEEARNARADVEARIARLEALVFSNPEFLGPVAAPHFEALGRPDRTVDRGGAE